VLVALEQEEEVVEQEEEVLEQEEEVLEQEEEVLEQEASNLVSGKLRQPPAPEKTTMLPSLRDCAKKNKPP